MSADWQPTPPHHCRLTIRCLRECFEFRLEPPYDFDSLRSSNTAIDTFFERRQNDRRGGEGGDRIVRLHERPVFSLHIGRVRGATWFDKTRPPEGVIWLLGVEPHDEAKKDRDDAYDRFARQEPMECYIRPASTTSCLSSHAAYATQKVLVSARDLMQPT